MKIAHLTTVDMSLRYLVLPQLEAALDYGESIGISAPGPYAEELEDLGIRHIPLLASTREMSVSADLRSAIQLWRVLRREDLDVLHTHNPKPGVYGRLIGRLAGVPIVVNTVHGLYATEDSSLPKRLAVYALEAFASRFSDAELVQSPEDYALLTARRITRPAKTKLLGNGVDLSRFNPVVAAGGRAEIRADLGASGDQLVVGMVGRLVAEKGVPELIELAERLDDSYLIVVVGPDDPEKDDALPREFLRRGEAAGVRFLGMRRDVERLYGAFDIFVLPSHRECFPRAAMEAAASGLPVIASDIRGCRQVVSAGKNGLLFPKGDVEALFQAIRAVGSDAELRQRMGEGSVEKARAEFDERDVVSTVISTYADLSAKKGLRWAFARRTSDPDIRSARTTDVLTIAELHRRMIPTGFLSTLGPGFLALLYRALIQSRDACLMVAEADGVVLGFIAGVTNTGGFYREFLRRHALQAVWTMAPSLLRPRSLVRILETLRQGTTGAGVDAELLSMAVAPIARRRGLGARLIAELFSWAGDRQVSEMRVVVGAENDGAIDLYRSAGFGDATSIEVHRDSPSLELVWRS